MYYGDNPQGLFVGRVGNQVIAYQNEAHRPRGEVRAPVPATWEGDKRINGGQDLRDQPVGGVEIVFSDEIPNFVKASFRVELITNHEPGWRPARGSAFVAEVDHNLVTGNAFHPAAFQIVIAAVEHFPRFCKLNEISGQSILQKLAGPTSALPCEVIELLSTSGAKCTSIPSRYGKTAYRANPKKFQIRLAPPEIRAGGCDWFPSGGISPSGAKYT